MAALTIRNIDERLKRDLRRQAAANERSMEEEARVILRRGVEPGAGSPRPGFTSEIRRLVEEYGAFEFELPTDTPYVPPHIE